MGESADPSHYETLQVSPNAESEVIAAAYRALAKKYHPDRSAAPDSMAHMARLNVAYQALKGRAGRIASGDFPVEPITAPFTRLSRESIDPKAPLEEILAVVSRMVATTRQRMIDEISADGLPREVATSLVSTALRALYASATDPQRARDRADESKFSKSASYDDALKIVTRQARVMRDQIADDLVRDGLNRSTAQELADTAFEQVRRKARNTEGTEIRLTHERVDLSGPFETGVRVVTAKVQAARQLVLDELTRDGIPLRTANQLIQAAQEAQRPTRYGT